MESEAPGTIWRLVCVNVNHVSLDKVLVLFTGHVMP